jgi:two-component system cell cycle response regulator
MDNNSVDKLMKTAQEAFIEDFVGKVYEVEQQLFSGEQELDEVDIHEVLGFFHSLNGTASTLGFTHLATIGKQWEVRLKELYAQGDCLDPVTTKELQAATAEVKSLIESFRTEQTVCLNEEHIQELSNGKILLVDDDIVILKLLENALVEEGYTVYICADSAVAFEMLMEVKPDVVILDIMMPKLDGYELLEKIKTNFESTEMQVIFLSALDEVDDKVKGIRLGADDYIAKPFMIEEVIARVEAVLRRVKNCKARIFRDRLTGIYTRCYFDQRIAEEYQRYKRYGKLFSIAFIDIDNYKAINDRYGHQVGDFVLKELVGYLADNIRRCDSLYRYGGEEFVALLPDTEETKAFKVIERLRKGFAQKSIYVEGTKINVTFSAGITQVSDRVSVRQLIRNADRAMYQAKRLGRNKVFIFDRAAAAGGHPKVLS